MSDEADRRAIAIGMVGPGLVGKTLLAQLAEQVRPDTGNSKAYSLTQQKYGSLLALPTVRVVIYCTQQP